MPEKVEARTARRRTVGWSIQVSHVLIDEDRVAVGVYGDDASRPGGALIGLLLQLEAGRLELALELADVGERGELLGILVPA